MPNAKPPSSSLRFALPLVFGLLVCAASASAQAQPARHAPVSAHAAERAVSRGAVVLDVRNAAEFASGSLPGAVSLPELAQQDSAQQAQRLSSAGVDLSREVLLLGEAGSEAVQALHQTLASVSSGQVLWLVGGLTEWQAIGATVAVPSASAQRRPVPQHLVRLPGAEASGDTSISATAMAAPQRRQAHAQAAELYGLARLY